MYLQQWKGDTDTMSLVVKTHPAEKLMNHLFYAKTFKCDITLLQGKETFDEIKGWLEPILEEARKEAKAEAFKTWEWAQLQAERAIRETSLREGAEAALKFDGTYDDSRIASIANRIVKEKTDE